MLTFFTCTHHLTLPSTISLIDPPQPSLRQPSACLYLRPAECLTLSPPCWSQSQVKITSSSLVFRCRRALLSWVGLNLWPKSGWNKQLLRTRKKRASWYFIHINASVQYFWILSNLFNPSKCHKASWKHLTVRYRTLHSTLFSSHESCRK